MLLASRLISDRLDGAQVARLEGHVHATQAVRVEAEDVRAGTEEVPQKPRRRLSQATIIVAFHEF